jgi:energy-coupling factor transport system substrate-specific component
MKRHWLGGLLLLVTTAIGAISFLYPFFLPQPEQNIPLSEVRSGETPLMYTLLLMVCLAVLLFDVQGQVADSKTIALLGILVSINSALRFIEVAVPGPGGFSPVFVLIILTGYVFGGRFGFLMGALTLLVSAIVTGGVGPWLPSQMFVAGWAGMSAPACLWLARRFGLEGQRGEVALLAVFGAFWGLLYGAIMNLWSWPFIAGPAEQYWAPGAGWSETVRRYLVYYLVTSLAWDSGRALGNFLLIALVGAPILRSLRRFRQRMTFSYHPLAAPASQPALEKGMQGEP